jgi:hypothetical protein
VGKVSGEEVEDTGLAEVGVSARTRKQREWDTDMGIYNGTGDQSLARAELNSTLAHSPAVVMLSTPPFNNPFSRLWRLAGSRGLKSRESTRSLSRSLYTAWRMVR